MADSGRKLRVFTSLSGDLEITANTTVPSLGTADKAAFLALSGMADAGFIPITINKVEYYIPLLQAN